MLEFRNVTIQYGNDLPVLNHFSLSLKKGEIISLVGESGSGKSTVLNAALGLLPGKGNHPEERPCPKVAIGFDTPVQIVYKLSGTKM